MSELPRALAPWAHELSILPRDLALSIGAHVARLSLAVGPLASSARGAGDEPDGVAGLARRGSYERLLASEWLLADELPDEFLRRAAAREHMFVEVARRAPAGSRRSVILFDAGPSQIGRPRVLHVAALIVFARRAAAAGATFGWGVLQKIGDGTHEEVTPDTVDRMLRARSAFEVSGALLDAWVESVGLPRAPDDLWIVGPPALATRARRAGASFLEIAEDPAPGARRLAARVRRGVAVPEVRLDLPPPEECARLLRDPFSAARPRRSRGSVSLAEPCALAFADPHRVAVATDEGFAVWPVPGSPRGQPGKLRHFRVPDGHALLAAGCARRRRLAVTCDADGALQLFDSGRDRPLALDLEASPVIEPRPRELPRCWYAHGALYFETPDRRLACVPDVASSTLALYPRATARIVSPDAVAVGRVAGAPVFAEALADAGRLTIRKVIRADAGGVGTRHMVTVPWVPDPDEHRRSVFFGRAPESYPFPGPLAVRMGPALWQIYVVPAGRPHAVLLPAGARAAGVVATREGPALVVVGANERAIVLLGASRSQPIARTAGRVVATVVDDLGPRIAWITDAGVVTVYSVKRRAVVATLEADGLEGGEGGA